MATLERRSDELQRRVRDGRHKERGRDRGEGRIPVPGFEIAVLECGENS
jgi:hypothetical protein